MEKLDVLIQESKKIAVNSFKNFCINLNLDPDLFNHIYNIDISVENTYEDNLAEYDTQKNIIIINKFYISHLMKQSEKNIINENKIKLNLALTIVHEMLHANRTIFINDGINNNIIINTIENGKKNIESFDDYVSLVSNFYMKQISSELLDKNYNNISKIIFEQYNFEETITETIAIIIILSRNDNNLDLNKITDKILNQNTYNDEKLMIKVIKDIGLKLLAWFMTSVYDDYYNYTMHEKVMNKYKKIK